MATQADRDLAHTMVKVYLEDGPPPNCWPHLRRESIVSELHDRIDSPYLVNQNATNLCGLASPLYELARDNPLGYVTLAIQLFLRGEAQMGSTTLKPSEGLRGDFPPSLVINGMNTPMAHADWMMLASIRQAYNSMPFDYRSPLTSLWSKIMEPLRGLTVPKDVYQLFRDFGYKHVYGDADWNNNQSWDSALEASRLRKAGYRVLLLINANLLDDDKMDESCWHGIGDHWVGLESSIVPSPSNPNYVAPISLYTWGDDCHWVPEKANRIAMNSFLKQYFGCIAAKY